MKYTNWPAPNTPATTPFYVSNEIEINAPVNVVWSWMVRVAWFHKWYRVWKNVRLEDGNGRLDIEKVGDVLLHKVDGFNLRTTIIDFVEDKQIAWTGGQHGMEGVHSWIFIPTDNGTYVRTEETLKGWYVPIIKPILKRKISKWHDYWLSQLKYYAEQGHAKDFYPANLHH